MWYDLVCLIIVGICAWRGMAKGFVWQLAAIAGIVLCFFFAEAVSIVVAPMTGLEPPLSRWVSILGLYVVGSFAAFAIARLIQDGLEKAKFEDYDRHLGAVFGFVKGATLCLVLSFFMFTLSERTRETVVHSHSGYASAVLLHKLDPVMPEGLHKILDPYVEGFDPDTIAQHLKEHPQHKEGDGHQHTSPTPVFPAPTQPGTQSPPTSNPFGSLPGNTTPNYTQSNQNTPPANPFQGDSVRQWLGQIQGAMTPELQQIVNQTIQQAAPSDRPPLVQQISQGLPGIIRQVTDQLNTPAPAPSTTPQQQQDWKQHRARLLREISGIYTDHPEAQQLIMEEVVHSLYGLPDMVTVAVLEDWYSDLRRLQPDPDPSTDMTSPLDKRILNQLTKAKISFNTLPAEMQSRLSTQSRR